MAKYYCYLKKREQGNEENVCYTLEEDEYNKLKEDLDGRIP